MLKNGGMQIASTEAYNLSMQIRIVGLDAVGIVTPKYVAAIIISEKKFPPSEIETPNI